MIRHPVVYIILCLPCFCGCVARFRAPERTHVPAPTTSSTPVVWRLPGPKYGNWLYDRTDLLRERDGEPVPCRRETRPGLIMEGQLIGVPFLPLDSYFRRPEMTPAEMNALPKAPLKRAHAALMIELDSPMPLYPLEITVGEAVVGTSKIGCFDRNGHRVTYGTIEREVATEGREDVLCRAGSFPDCRRLKVVLRFRFPWGPDVDVTEYVWLADGLGEVRRVEHITGWMWFFWMESAYEYSLASFEPMAVKGQTRPAASQSADEAVDWSHVAVVFDRVLPHPRVSGLRVELTSGKP